MIPAPVAAFASRIGLTGLAIAILCLLLAVQTVRLEGLRIWPLDIEGARPKAERMERERDALIEAQKAAGDAQRSVNDAKQQDYNESAEESEDDKKLTDIAVRGAVAEYARTHRVQPNRSCSSSGASPATASGPPGVAEGMPAVAGVLVSEPDLRALSDAAGYAVSCHNFAVSVAD